MRQTVSRLRSSRLLDRIVSSTKQYVKHSFRLFVFAERVDDVVNAALIPAPVHENGMEPEPVGEAELMPA